MRTLLLACLYVCAQFNIAQAQLLTIKEMLAVRCEPAHVIEKRLRPKGWMFDGEREIGDLPSIQNLKLVLGSSPDSMFPTGWLNFTIYENKDINFIELQFRNPVAYQGYVEELKKRGFVERKLREGTLPTYHEYDHDRIRISLSAKSLEEKNPLYQTIYFIRIWRTAED